MVPIGDGRGATRRRPQTLFRKDVATYSLTCGVWLLPALTCGCSIAERVSPQVNVFRDHPTHKPTNHQPTNERTELTDQPTN